MGVTPEKTLAAGTPFTLRQFVAAAKERLHLEVVVDAGLDRKLDEPMMYRPGLALTGFFENFAHKRIQVLGKAEMAYLASLGPDECRARLKALLEHGSNCLVVACGFPVPEGAAELGRAAGATLLTSDLLTRELIHQGTFILEALRAPKTKVYGTMVEVAGLGVMLEGAPGLGKSETALGLVKHGNALVADDLTCLRLDLATGRLLASASEATRNYMEIRGIGIIHVPSVFGVSAVRGEKQLDLVVTFKRMDEVSGDLDRAGEDRYVRTILGVEVPQLIIPVSAGRDLVNLVETAAQQFKLRLAGRDATKELDAQLRARAAQQS